MNNPTTMHTVSVVGDLAYLDTFAGLVPCKVTECDGQMVNGSGFASHVTIRFTATRGAWKRGETVRIEASRVVPRTHVRTRGGIPWVIGGWHWADRPLWISRR